MIKILVSILLICATSCKEPKAQKVLVNKPDYSFVIVSSSVSKEEATHISSLFLQKGIKKVHIRKDRDLYQVVIGWSLDKKSPFFQTSNHFYYGVWVYIKSNTQFGFESINFEFLT